MGWSGGGGTPKPTEEEKALAKDSAIAYNDYQQRFVPLENEYISRFRATDGDLATQKGIGSADTYQAAHGGDTAAVQRGMGAGVGATSGRSIMARADIASARGGTAGEVIAARELDRKDMELRGLLKMSAFGRDLADTNRLATANLADQKTQASIAKLNSKMKEQAAYGEAAGSLAGMATSYFTNPVSSGAGIAGPSKPWWDITSRPMSKW